MCLLPWPRTRKTAARSMHQLCGPGGRHVPFACSFLLRQLVIDLVQVLYGPSTLAAVHPTNFTEYSASAHLLN
ncbi:hypothetical protein HYQ45_017464 [Verticillium longisporum]|uniref:Uncharacterized protein n=1 Tax=Verticillium longisporum TaxID=100787 RepID=A0A8I2Z307_VERLO|nr:hypothetical protein HYQ45_017464 [Verticillium longisporum]